MTDQDLIVEGHRLAAHTADEAPHIGRLRDVLAALLDALEAGRARVAELEPWYEQLRTQARRAVEDDDRWYALRVALDGQSVDLAEMIDAILDQRDKARARVAELEAAQRPPLGYVVLEKRPDRQNPGTDTIRTAGPIWLDREVAERQLAQCEDRAVVDPRWYGNATHLVAEVREVQP